MSAVETQTQNVDRAVERRRAPKCRACDARLQATFCNLGTSPLANAIVEPERVPMGERFFPLHAYVCEQCFLVQLEGLQSPEEIFSHYSYFSSYADTLLRHARDYVEKMTERWALGRDSQVVEIGSNDGYLLQYFVERGVPALGVEPAGNVAEVAIAKGVPTTVRFFGAETARELVGEGQRANLLLANNVLAHVPELRDFVAGLKILLAPGGVFTAEFPHLLRLIEENQFDTIYHEHFCYFSLSAVAKVFEAQGLRIFDVDRLSTHGGSLRIYARHEEDGSKPVSDAVRTLYDEEREAGLLTLAAYRDFEEGVRETKRKLLEFLIAAKRQGKRTVAYGAAAKGNTLFNYCGIGQDFIDFIADRSVHKQGRLLPGTHIPIVAPERIAETRPDYVLIIPWNLKDEIVDQMQAVREWGGKFVVAIPEVQVF